MHHCRTRTASIDWIRHGHACSNVATGSKDWGPVAMQYARRTADPSMDPTIRISGLSDLGIACVKAARDELFIPSVPPYHSHQQQQQQQYQGNSSHVPFAANYNAVACSMIPRAIETAMLLFLPSLSSLESQQKTRSRRRRDASLLPVLYVCDGIGERPTHAMLGFDIHNRTPWTTIQELADFVNTVGREHGLDVSNVNLQYAMERSPNSFRAEKQILKRRPDHPSQFYSSPFMQMMIQSPAGRRGGTARRDPEVRLCVVSHGKYIRKSLSLGSEGGGNPALFSTPNVSIHRQHLAYECTSPSSWISTCVLGKVEPLWAPDTEMWNKKHLAPADVARCGFTYLKMKEVPVQKVQGQEEGPPEIPESPEESESPSAATIAATLYG